MLRKFSLFAAICLPHLCFSVVYPASGNELTQLNVVVKNNRKPYSFADDSGKQYGILTDRISALCKVISSHCIFRVGDFFSNLESLQEFKADVMLVIDTAVVPESDEISLTEPLCVPEFFILHNSGGRSTGKDVVKGAAIGVLYDSQAHLHLLENFYSISKVKSYGILESAIFDLRSNRIDAVALEAAFFRDRIASHNIFNDIASDENKLSMKSSALNQQSMRLAVKSSNETLLNRLNAGIQQLGEIPGCEDLLKGASTAGE